MTSSNTPATPKDVQDAEAKDEYRRNLEKTRDVPSEEQTASHIVLPSDIESLQHAHTLTFPEAEKAAKLMASGMNQAIAVESAKNGRMIVRHTMIETPAGISHPLNLRKE